MQDLFFEFGNLSDVLFWVRFELALTVTATQTYNLFLVGNGLIGINITTGKGAFLVDGRGDNFSCSFVTGCNRNDLSSRFVLPSCVDVDAREALFELVCFFLSDLGLPEIKFL